MKHISSFLGIIFLFSATFLFTPTSANAIDKCPSFETSPQQPWKANSNISSVDIGISGVAEGTTLFVYSNRPDSPHNFALLSPVSSSGKPEGIKATNNKLSFVPHRTDYTLMEGAHRVIVTTNNATSGQVCESQYVVLSSYVCNINNIDSNRGDYKLSYGPNQSINIEGTFYNSDNNSERPPRDWKIDVRVFDNKGNEYARQDIDTNDGNGNFKASIQTPNIIPGDKVGVWHITASQNGKNLFAEQACTRGIYVSQVSGEAPPASASTFLNASSNSPGLPGTTSFFGGSGNSKGPTPTDPCPVNAQGAHICSTAIGDIDASGAIGIITTLFKYLISVVGVGAIILLLVGGYRMILSRGDKEKLHEARDTITSAILGLVFIILSLVILQIIGVSILQIPGFSQ